MANSFPKVTLSNGGSIPVIGLGTWKSSSGEVTQAVKDAIDCGYRHFDCAYIYGNEAEVGTALKTKIADSTVTRDGLFITSKLWNTFHSKNLVKPSLKETLEALGLDYVDLYLIHWPMGYQEGGELFPVDENNKTLYSSVDYIETWQAMEECVDEGLTKAIGLSNFNRDQIQRILSIARIKPVSLQVECNPYVNQSKLIEFCKTVDIAVTAFSPLGSPTRPWVKPEDPNLLDEPKIVTIASRYNKTPAQILIRYQIQRGVIVIPKSVTKSRIESNVQVFDFELSPEEMDTLNSFNCNGRALHLTWVNDHPHYPFHREV